MEYLSPGTMSLVRRCCLALSHSSPGIISIKCWIIVKETCLFDETVQFNRNYKHCYSAASYGCRSFQSLPCCWLSYTSSYPQVHTCSLWNANCTSNTLLRRCGSMFGFRSSDSMLDVDWCYNDSLTAPLFARLQQLHSFKQMLLSHLEHCPISMDTVFNILIHWCLLIVVWSAHGSSP